jgi:hypothetical protein
MRLAQELCQGTRKKASELCRALIGMRLKGDRMPKDIWLDIWFGPSAAALDPA